MLSDFAKDMVKSVEAGRIKRGPKTIARGAAEIVNGGKFSEKDVEHQIQLGRAKAKGHLQELQKYGTVNGEKPRVGESEEALKHIVGEWDEVLSHFSEMTSRK